MCYAMRAEQAEPGREGASQPSSGLERLRPRVVGAAMAVLVAGFAAAALLETPAPPNGMETSMGVDDGVPTALNQARSHGGECHHGLQQPAPLSPRS